MALSNKQTLSKGRDLIGGKAKDSRHTSNKQKDPMRSYAQILKTDQERATFDLKSQTPDELGELTKGGQLFLQARDKHSVVVSTEQFLTLQANFKDVATALRSQFPDARGLRLRNVNPTTSYFEINFPSDAAREAALKKDFTYQEKRVTVSRTYPKDTTIIRVSVSNLPFDDEEELKAQMSRIFVNYGAILEMGLLHTVHGHFFTGRGFVTLNLIPGKTYATLTPQIDSWEAGETLKLTWADMPVTCSRCHVADHVFGNCPVMRNRGVKLCHVCKSSNHLQQTCPKAWWNERKSKAAKVSKAHTSPNQKPLDKVAEPTVTSVIEAVESSPETGKAPSAPFITAIIPASSNEATNTQSTNEESPSTTEATVSQPSSDEVGKDVSASGEEQMDNQEDVGVTAQEGSVVLQEQAGDIFEDDYDDDMDSDDDEDTDIDMNEAAKEAAASSQTVEEVVQRKKLQIRIQRRKIKQQAKGSMAMGSKAKDKAKEKAMDNVLRPRHGGISSKGKGTTIHSSRK